MNANAIFYVALVVSLIVQCIQFNENSLQKAVLVKN